MVVALGECCQIQRTSGHGPSGSEEKFCQLQKDPICQKLLSLGCGSARNPAIASTAKYLRFFSVFLYIFMEMLSWPTEFLLLDFKMIFLLSDICGRGIVNVLFTLG